MYSLVVFISVNSDGQKFHFVFFVFVGEQEVDGPDGTFGGDGVPRDGGQGELVTLRLVGRRLVGVEDNFLKN